jgi:ribonucleoside-triphosphate reductase
MTDRKDIEAHIAELRGELSRAEGTPTEVYSRIVGYYRSVRNWNAGKREEYGDRVAYAMPSGRGRDRPEETAIDAAPAARGPSPAMDAATTKPVGLALPGDSSLRDGVLVFTREACPNCSPLANYVISSGMKAVFVDVDRDEGLALARDLGVLATPTVLGMDGEGRESFRAFDLKGLRSSLSLRGGLETGTHALA